MLFPLSPLLQIPPLSSSDIPLHLLHHNVFTESGAPSSSLLIGTASRAIEQSINPLGGVPLSVFLSPETALGRRGRASRPESMDLATPIGVWIALGFLDPQEPPEE